MSSGANLSKSTEPLFYEGTNWKESFEQFRRPTADAVSMPVVSLGSKQATFFVDWDSDGFIVHGDEEERLERRGGKRKGSHADVDFHWWKICRLVSLSKKKRKNKYSFSIDVPDLLSTSLSLFLNCFESNSRCLRSSSRAKLNDRQNQRNGRCHSTLANTFPSTDNRSINNLFCESEKIHSINRLFRRIGWAEIENNN